MVRSRKKILISHPWVARGGSEATAMWVLDSLQDEFDVTFVTAHVDSWEELNSAYGTSIQSDKVKIARCSRLPLVNSATRLVHLQHRHFEKFCRSIAPRFDLCISAYNPIDFGDDTESLQLIGDFSFSEKMRRKLYVNADSTFQHRESLIRRLYLKLGDFLGVPQRELHTRKNERVIANSQWAVEQLEEEFHIPNAPVLYPPVLLPETDATPEKRPLSFVSLGRISPEKEIEKIIAILKRVREDHNIEATLTLIGQLDDSDYSQKIEALVAENTDWITPAGFLTADAKQNLLAAHEFALHGCRIEAFGIAVAEMASLGCVPVVPQTGGAGEIAEFDELKYTDENDAVQKIVTLIENPERTHQFREHLKKSVHRFGPDAFRENLLSLLKPVSNLPNSHVEKSDPALV